MIDYGRKDRQRFLRQLRCMAALRALGVAVPFLLIAGVLAAVARLFVKGH